MRYGHISDTATIKTEKVDVRHLHISVVAGVNRFNAIDCIPVIEGKTKKRKGSVVYHILETSLVESKCLVVPVEEQGEAKQGEAKIDVG